MAATFAVSILQRESRLYSGRGFPVMSNVVKPIFGALQGTPDGYAAYRSK
jgi:hypothetical protein